MAIKKINTQNFTKIEMVARLFILQRNWSKEPQSIVLNKAKALSYTKKILKLNFIYPKDKEEKISLNLVLFLMGNDNNMFSKAIK